MNKIIFISLGVILFNLSACNSANKTIKPPANTCKNLTKKKTTTVTKKSIRKETPQSKEKKIIKEYRSVVSSNIQKTIKQKEAKREYESRKKRLLKEMELSRATYAKTQDRESYLQQKNRIVKELKKAQKKYESSLEKNRVVNYTDNESIGK